MLKPENFNVLLETNLNLTIQLREKDLVIQAKDRKIQHLNFLLEQRVEATKKAYNPAQIAEMCRKCYEVFLDSELTPPGLGYTETDFLVAFEQKWHFKSAHLPQRLRDLVKDGYLWRDNRSKDVVFRLKLVDDKAKVWGAK